MFPNSGWRLLPWSIPMLALLLMGAGWLGIYRSEELVDGDGARLGHQLLWSCLGCVIMLAAAAPNYRLACRGAYWALAGLIVLLVAVYLFAPINGAHRWIRLGHLGFQPSEFAKPIVVLAVARYLMYRDNFRSGWGLLVPLAIVLLPAWLVLKEPDLGTSLVFLPVLFAMLWAAGARPMQLAGLALVGLALLPLLWQQMSRDQRGRVTALWEQHFQNMPDHSPTPASYHLHQAREMFALGGFWGTIWAPSPPLPDQRPIGRVPEPHTDSIFCVLGERFGIVGAMALLLLYALLVWRGLAIAGRTGEPFGRLVAVGVTALIGVQAAINMGMLVGLLPITGVSLPLVSYGGSGLVANCLALGLLANIGLRPGYEMTADPFVWQARG